jgi:hypothetical protein
VGIAEKIKATQSSFPAQEPSAIATCPAAQSPPAEDAQIAVAEVVAPPKKVEQPKTQKKTWVEFVLVDMEGKPVPGVRYRVHLPAEETPHEGVLNNLGQAGFYEIEPGTCRITFPDLDKDAWDSA